MENPQIKRMQELVQVLNHASKVYYSDEDEIMSNYEYDQLYDELAALEANTGIVLPNSPTATAGADVNEDATTITHEYPALSLEKTKDISLFPKLFNTRDRKAVTMWKEDGCTIVATYDDGTLTTLATRGNGKVGEDITHNAKYIHGLPQTVPFTTHFVVRGEALMSYAEYERINASLDDDDELYKNPRNLASSTIRLAPEKEMEHREIWFHAFKLVHTEEELDEITFENQMLFLEKTGFTTTHHVLCDVKDLLTVMDDFSNNITNYEFPVDGLVVAANDVVYAESLPGTGHNPHKLVGYALKWQDTTIETTLRDIEWSPSRTGRINPIAVFDPVELEGTTVTKASIHNVSILKKLHLHIGDEISVYKANKIIPQIAENLSEFKPMTYEDSHPVKCPCCDATTSPLITTNNDVDVEIAICPNPDCPAKHVGKFTHFIERDCMNINGLSKATMATFVKHGWITSFADIYHLDRYKDDIVSTSGFGQKSYTNMISAVNKSRKTSFIPFIHALGIPSIGKGQAELFAKAYDYDISRFLKAVHDHDDFTHINGIGPILNNQLHSWGEKYLVYMDDDTATTEIRDLLNELTFIKPEISTKSQKFKGLTFVITGDVHHFKNRNELKAKIVKLGGKVTGSVSKNTSYLVNNDVTSSSNKNKTAKQLGIPIISEDDIIDMIHND